MAQRGRAGRRRPRAGALPGVRRRCGGGSRRRRGTPPASPELRHQPEAEHVAVEARRSSAIVRDLQVDVAHHRAGRQAVERLRRRVVELAEEVVDVERQRRHPLGDLALPVLARAVPVDLDAVVVGVAEVERLADEVVGRARRAARGRAPRARASGRGRRARAPAARSGRGRCSRRRAARRAPRRARAARAPPAPSARGPSPSSSTRARSRRGSSRASARGRRRSECTAPSRVVGGCARRRPARAVASSSSGSRSDTPAVLLIAVASRRASPAPPPRGRRRPADVEPDPGRALERARRVLSPDGLGYGERPLPKGRSCSPASTT